MENAEVTKAKEMTEVQAEFVSLVDRAANKRKFAIIKQADPENKNEYLLPFLLSADEVNRVNTLKSNRMTNLNENYGADAGKKNIEKHYLSGIL